MLYRIQKYPGRVEVMVAGEALSDLHTVEVTALGNAAAVQEGRTATLIEGMGVVRGTVASGAIARVQTAGRISGLICATAINAGDRVAVANLTSGPGLASGNGLVQSLNSILLSGNAYGVVSGIQTASGLISGGTSPLVSGSLLTGGVIGKALTSGGIGSGIQVLLTGG